MNSSKNRVKETECKKCKSWNIPACTTEANSRELVIMKTYRGPDGTNDALYRYGCRLEPLTFCLIPEVPGFEYAEPRRFIHHVFDQPGSCLIQAPLRKTDPAYNSAPATRIEHHGYGVGCPSYLAAGRVPHRGAAVPFLSKRKRKKQKQKQGSRKTVWEAGFEEQRKRIIRQVNGFFRVFWWPDDHGCPIIRQQKSVHLRRSTFIPIIFAFWPPVTVHGRFCFAQKERKTPGQDSFQCGKKREFSGFWGVQITTFYNFCLHS